MSDERREGDDYNYDHDERDRCECCGGEGFVELHRTPRAVGRGLSVAQESLADMPGVRWQRVREVNGRLGQGWRVTGFACG
jgi:hypothetical protein